MRFLFGATNHTRERSPWNHRREERNVTREERNDTREERDGFRERRDGFRERRDAKSAVKLPEQRIRRVIRVIVAELAAEKPIELIEHRGQAVAPVIANAYDFSSFNTIVDIGGGDGALLTGILSAHPKLRGTLFDRPDVIERARGVLASSPLQSRIDLAPGSFFEVVPAGLDAYLLEHVIHDWNDADAGAILKACRRAMPAHAKLLLVEGLYPQRVEPSFESQGATANDVNMLVCTGGRQRSEAEFRELLAAASFQLTRIVPASMGICVIESVPC